MKPRDLQELAVSFMARSPLSDLSFASAEQPRTLSYERCESCNEGNVLLCFVSGKCNCKFSASLKKLCGALWYIFLDTKFLPDFMLPVVKNRPANAGDTELGV